MEKGKWLIAQTKSISTDSNGKKELFGRAQIRVNITMRLTFQTRCIVVNSLHRDRSLLLSKYMLLFSCLEFGRKNLREYQVVLVRQNNKKTHNIMAVKAKLINLFNTLTS